MKIKDVFANWVSESQLFEMAFKRKVAIDKIRSFQLQIAKHLIKHLYYDVSEETKKHWEQEIDTWLNDIDETRLKKGKTLDGSVYYHHLFTEPLGERSDVTRKIKKINTDVDMKQKEGLIDITKLHENLEKILHDVSYDLFNEKLKNIREYIDNV